MSEPSPSEADTDPTNSQTWQGPCRGGPLDGQECVSRYPAGLVVADLTAGHVWVYRWRPEQRVFEVVPCSPDGAIERDVDVDRLTKAALDNEWDVVGILADEAEADDGES